MGTSNRSNIDFEELAFSTRKSLKDLKVDCLICIGGDGTLGIAHRLALKGVSVVGVPKTIDNDVRGTDITFGFDTAVHIATEGVDRLHTTAESHHRVMLLEVMGRRAGWIALYAGLAGGGDIILIPEIPYNMDKVIEKIKERGKKGKKFTIMVVAEGAKPHNGNVAVSKIVDNAPDPVRLGGISFILGKEIEMRTGIETRNVVLGHLQRGGSPFAFDRILGTQLGTKAVDLIWANDFGFMAGVHHGQIIKVPLLKVAQGQKLLPVNHPLIKTARSVGICFGV